VAHGPHAYENACAALRGLDLDFLRGKRVLLKPNAGRVAAPDSGIVTNCDVVAGAVDVLRDAGAEVAIGESPIVGVKVLEAFERAGIAAVARSRNCPLIDLDQRRFVRVPVPQGVVLRELRVCPEVLEFDAVVSVPVLKMHMHTGVTLSVKNMKGCLWRRSKVELHMLPPVAGSDEKPIDIAIADMSSVLRPHLAVIDGTVGMEGLGPSAGTPKRANLVLAGRDAYAADAVACRLMGISAAEIPHLRIGASRGLGTIALTGVHVRPQRWEEWISPFQRPPENLAIEFPNITVHDLNSCSACQSTLLLFLKHHQQRVFDYFSPDEPVDIAIGKGHHSLPQGTLCLGNCTANLRDKGIFVPGCPPVGSQILEALRGRSETDNSNPTHSTNPPQPPGENR
jgi:uncharacterized protein (DUF362 family)